MVRRLGIFQERFAAYADQYVLIGGTAASLTMEEAGLEFRATKDLDIVLHGAPERNSGSNEGYAIAIS
jgi:hypothetical protein